MSHTKTLVCDRCGKEINTRKFPISKITKLKMQILFGFGCYDYADVNYDLCQNCTKEFEKFKDAEVLK